MHLLENFEKTNIGWDLCTCIEGYPQLRDGVKFQSAPDVMEITVP
jgi:hypothetical protein